MKLNKASLNTWYEMFKDEKCQEISERILILESSHDLSAEDKLEMNTLIKLEKKFLKEANDNILKVSKVSQKIYDYKVALDEDERLKAIFLDRAMNKFMNDELNSEEDVTKLYDDMRLEDVDVEGHDNLNKLFHDLQLAQEGEANEIQEVCDNPDCIYCKNVTDEENEKAHLDLLKGGYYDGNVKLNLMELMIRINRLEDKLEPFIDINCNIEFNIEDLGSGNNDIKLIDEVDYPLFDDDDDDDDDDEFI